MEKRQRAVDKKDRVPVGGLRTKLQLSVADQKELAGYNLHWFNDKDGRIEAALGAGYTFVEPTQARSLGVAGLHQENSDLNAKVSKVVSRGTGDPIRAYLMKINKEWHEEDLAEKIRATQAVDESLRPVTQGGQTVESGYTPR